MSIKHFVAFGAIAAVTYGYNQYDTGSRFAALAGEFNLDHRQIQVMGNCNSALTRHARQFKDGIDNDRACACIARRLATDLDDSSLALASSMLDVIVAESAKSSRNVARAISSNTKLARLDESASRHLLQLTSRSIGYCGRARNHASKTIAKAAIENAGTR